MNIKCKCFKYDDHRFDSNKNTILLKNRIFDGCRYGFIKKEIGLYKLNVYNPDISLTSISNKGLYVRPINIWNKQKFLIMYNIHWFQDKNNMKWLVGLIGFGGFLALLKFILNIFI